CLVSPDVEQSPVLLSRRVEDHLKKWRPIFRMIGGYRALRDGIKGVLAGKRGSAEHVKSTLSFLSGSSVVRGRPMNITIEPTSACNLGCPVCETGAGKLNRATKHMTFDEFKTIVDKVGANTNTLMFYFMGEPFINRQSYEMIRYAKSLGIPHIT